MICYEKDICSWNDLNSFVAHVTGVCGDEPWFRGQPDFDYKLIPSVQRKEYTHKYSEQYMATNFMIETQRRDPDTPEVYNRAAWLALMQHYGLPTRLLDWSASPLVSLFFALDEKEPTDRDAALWALDAQRLNNRMGEGAYLFPMGYRTVEKYLRGAFDGRVEKSEKIIACCGMGTDLRMYVQQSNFTVHDTTHLALDEMIEAQDILWKARIPGEVKRTLMDELKLLGFHESTIYPDMQHIANEQRAKFAGRS